MPPIIRIALPSTLPQDSVNMYLVKDDPLTLIDAGFNNPVTRHLLEAALGQEGLRLTDIRRVVLTHTHPDHVGQAAALQASGSEVFIHPTEWAKIQNGTADNGAILTWAGVPPAVVPSIRRGGPREPVYPTAVTFLREGDKLEFEHGLLEVLLTPGHSSGQLCLYSPQDESILTSDMVVPHFSPSLLVEATEDGRRTDSYNQYIASLERLEPLPVRQVYPGHGDPFPHFRETIQKLYQVHRRKLGRIAAILTGAPKTAFAVMRELSPGLSGFICFFAAGDTIAHLDKLVELGIAAVNREAGILRYWRRE